MKSTNFISGCATNYIMLLLVMKVHLKWNHFGSIKIHVDTLSKPWVHCPQSHAAITEKPAAKTENMIFSLRMKSHIYRRNKRHSQPTIIDIALYTGSSPLSPSGDQLNSLSAHGFHLYYIILYNIILYYNIFHTIRRFGV